MLKKLAQLEEDLGVSRNTLYAMKRAGLRLHNIGAGDKRPTWAAEEDDVRSFLVRPLFGDRSKSAAPERGERRRRVHRATGRQWSPRPAKGSFSAVE